MWQKLGVNVAKVPPHPAAAIPVPAAAFYVATSAAHIGEPCVVSQCGPRDWPGGFAPGAGDAVVLDAPFRRFNP